MLKRGITRPCRLGRRFNPFSVQKEKQLLRIIEMQEAQLQRFLDALIEIKAEWDDPLTQLANQAGKKINKQ